MLILFWLVECGRLQKTAEAHASASASANGLGISSVPCVGETIITAVPRQTYKQLVQDADLALDQQADLMYKRGAYHESQIPCFTCYPQWIFLVCTKSVLSAVNQLLFHVI